MRIIREPEHYFDHILVVLAIPAIKMNLWVHFFQFITTNVVRLPKYVHETRRDSCLACMLVQHASELFGSRSS